MAAYPGNIGAASNKIPNRLRFSKPTPKPWESPPPGWRGSKPEWAIYWALEKLGRKEGVDFFWQSPFAGGRLNRGGAIIDFVLPDLNLGIRVQGIYWHYERMNTQALDQIQLVAIEGSGMIVVDIDEDDALKNPLVFTRYAMQGIDKSRRIRR